MSLPNDVKVAIGVLAVFGILLVFNWQPGDVEQELFVPAYVANPYDLNGDGFISDADAVVYTELFDRLNFNGYSQVDIFDQVMLASEMEPVVMIYLPVIYNEE